MHHCRSSIGGFQSYVLFSPNCIRCFTYSNSALLLFSKLRKVIKNCVLLSSFSIDKYIFNSQI